MQSPSIANLAAAIVAAQQELKPVKRDQQNPFYRSTYADLAACWEACAPFRAHGIAITQSPVPPPAEGFVCLQTQLTHTSGEWMSSQLLLPITKADPQGVGSAITYARRYALGCMTGLVTEEDDDGNSQVAPPPPQPRRPLSDSENKKPAGPTLLAKAEPRPAATRPPLDPANVQQQFVLAESMEEWDRVAHDWQAQVVAHDPAARNDVWRTAMQQKARIEAAAASRPRTRPG